MSDFKLYNDLPRVLPSPLGKKPPVSVPSGSSGPNEASFGKVLKDAVDQVSSLEKTSQNELQGFLKQETDLHNVMLALEKADLSFQLMMQVRNKVVQAYQEIMRTQV